MGEYGVDFGDGVEVDLLFQHSSFVSEHQVASTGEFLVLLEPQPHPRPLLDLFEDYSVKISEIRSWISTV
jgi:hypothetical protein